MASNGERTSSLVPLVVWGSMLAAVGVYVVAGLGIRWRVGPGVVAVLAPVLGILAGVELWLQSRYARRLSDAYLFPRLKDPQSGLYQTPRLRRLSNLPPAERGARALPAVRLSHQIVLWVVAESLALYGFLLTALSGDERFLVAFSAAAILDLLWFFPRPSAAEEQEKRWRRFVVTGRR